MAAAEGAPGRSLATLSLLAGVWLVAVGPATAAEGLAIVGATVFDGTGAPAIAEAVIVVEGSKIRSVGPRSLVALPKGIPYVDGRGLFVVPGRLREPDKAAALREKVGGGTAFERALTDVLRATAAGPSNATIEPGHPADLVVLEKDPRVSLDNLGSVKRVFVAGRETAP
jgi:cytosine/adenosine deaminase-related metal-dependent hydrolase